ncbi:MAG: LicD family protein [Ruminococcaceae bacterium]|nr:LicD family protein [Oscillospiraceae bacterium]
MHEIQFAILKVCRDICQRYGLVYYLFGDTLRGAVQKGDFLPDSTEAALLMPVGDMKNFCAYFAREAPEGLVLSGIETEKEYPALTVCIRKEGTVGGAKRLLQMPGHHGIGVTVYPYYPVDAGQFARLFKHIYVRIAERLLGAARVPYLEKPGFIDRLLAKIPVEKRRAVAKMAIRRLEAGSKKSMQVCTPLQNTVFFWREALGEECFTASLRGEKFPVPDRREVFMNMVLPDGKQYAADDMVWDVGCAAKNANRIPPEN